MVEVEVETETEGPTFPNRSPRHSAHMCANKVPVCTVHMQKRFSLTYASVLLASILRVCDAYEQCGLVGEAERELAAQEELLARLDQEGAL